jgi:hypothetical protein
MTEALAHIHSLAARPRILRGLPSQLTASRLNDRAMVAAVQSAIACHQLLADADDDASTTALDEVCLDTYNLRRNSFTLTLDS